MKSRNPTCQSPEESWISLNLSFRYILFREKKTPNDAVTPQRQSQFTPKMKANAVPRLLSSLVWIDQYDEGNGMTSFMEFMQSELCGITPFLETNKHWDPRRLRHHISADCGGPDAHRVLKIPLNGFMARGDDKWNCGLPVMQMPQKQSLTKETI